LIDVELGTCTVAENLEHKGPYDRKDRILCIPGTPIAQMLQIDRARSSFQWAVLRFEIVLAVSVFR